MSNQPQDIFIPAGSLLALALFNDHVRMMVPGAAAPKDVSIADAMALISSGLAQSVSLPTMELPYGTIRAATSPTELQLCIYREGAVHTVHHTNGENYEIPFPNIVFNVTLKKKTVNGNQVWHLSQYEWSATPLTVAEVRSLRTKFPSFSNEEKFYKLPLPNIYSEGKVCLGNNHMPHDFSDSSLAGVQYWIDFLYKTPFNNDLSVPHRSRNVSRDGSRYLSWLNGKKTFPYGILTGEE